MTPFEHAIEQATHTQNWDPVWELLLNTDFFVPVHTKDEVKTNDFHFVIHENAERNEPCIILSEVADRLAIAQTTHALKILGGKIIEMLNPQVGILIALEKGGFGLPIGLVAQLRSRMQAASGSTSSS